MRSTYINGSQKFLIAAVSAACLGVCLMFATGAGATTKASHAGVPANVKLIDVTVLAPSGSSTTAVNTLKAHNYVLTKGTTVRALNKLVDTMGNVPDRSYACPMFVLANQPKMTMTFRATAGGPALAEIQVDVAVGPHHESGSSPCRPISFSIRNRVQKSLLSTTFVEAVGLAIGADIS